MPDECLDRFRVAATDDLLIKGADVCAVNTRDIRGHIYGFPSSNVDRYYALPYPADYENLPEPAELVVGKATGRTKNNQVTLLVNNMGLGIQFAATAKGFTKGRGERELHGG